MPSGRSVFIHPFGGAISNGWGARCRAWERQIVHEVAWNSFERLRSRNCNTSSRLSPAPKGILVFRSQHKQGWHRGAYTEMERMNQQFLSSENFWLYSCWPASDTAICLALTDVLAPFLQVSVTFRHSHLLRLLWSCSSGPGVLCTDFFENSLILLWLELTFLSF